MKDQRPPPAQPDWAYFLDVDGTLAEIAPRPELARPDAEMIAALDRLASWCGGAVALVSGRPIAEIDRLFAPLRLAAAGLHGLERRGASGALVAATAPAAALDPARAALSAFASAHPGTLVEDKGATVALHYREAPHHEAAALALAEDLATRSAGALLLQRGKMVAELRPPGPTKGDVVAAFLAEPPFAGRRPVFVGDDETDEDGFRAVESRGGVSIRIGAPAASAARYRLPSVAALRGWLTQAQGVRA